MKVAAKKTHKRGQVTVVLVLGVAVVGLAIALSEFTKSTESLRRTQYSVQKEEAYACAEAGIEVAVKCVNDCLEGTYPGCTGNDPQEAYEKCQQADYVLIDTSDVGSCSYKYTSSLLTDAFVIPSLPKDTTEVAVLDASSTNLNLTWDQNDGNALEVNVLTDAGATGFTITQYVYNCGYSGDLSGSDVITTGDGTTCETATPINVSGADLVQMTARGDAVDQIDVQIGGGAGTQGFDIVSTGSIGDTRRQVEVLYMLSNIARVFNNTFYADSVVEN